jgi:hypothetical protein|tara:strand:- start:1143 stop:2450 length:1308 start_codon:yes stop_codon:yes gene_type:complete
MGSARNTASYEEITIESSFSEKTVDLRLGVVSFDYYEDLLSPTITARLVVIDGGNTVVGQNGKLESLYSGLPIRGGERVSIHIKPEGQANSPGLLFNSPERYLYVSKISSVVKEGQRELLVLDLTSRESIGNEITRISNRFAMGNGISNSAITILERLGSKFSEIDDTSNTYGFIGNMKKPFSLLIWLASKAVDNQNNSGFFFFQTHDGFKFKSISKLINAGKNGPKFVYKNHEIPQSPLTYTDDIILNYNVTTNHNLIEKLRRGMYSSFSASFNPLFGAFTLPQDGVTNINDNKPSVTMGDEFRIPKLLGGRDIPDLPSRIMTMVDDVGTIDNGISIQQNADIFNRQRESILRYNLLFMQILEIQVPMNSSLRAGDMIRCDFVKTSSDKTNKGVDPDLSGLYMIKELCHHFEVDQSITSMKLVRDTYGKPDTGT